MLTLHTVDAMRQASTELRSQGLRIGFVPTMGYLHQGHRSLMRRLRPQVDRLVVSIYVNPLQFAPHEDFDVYPRDPEGDAAACRDEGVDVIFMPPPAGHPDGLYPPGFQTRIHVPALDDGRLCSVSRPHFFEGVATVCFRLFQVVGCHAAAFGQKDFQQLTIIRRMVRDLELGIDIVGGPIIREPDGLAMSSRNVYLKGADRQRAVSLSRALRTMQQAVAQGQTQVSALLESGRAQLDVDTLDYLEVVDVDTLQPLTHVSRESRAAVAAVVGQTRLIDNIALVPPA